MFLNPMISSQIIWPICNICLSTLICFLCVTSRMSTLHFPTTSLNISLFPYLVLLYFLNLSILEKQWAKFLYVFSFLTICIILTMRIAKIIFNFYLDSGIDISILKLFFVYLILSQWVNMLIFFGALTSYYGRRKHKLRMWKVKKTSMVGIFKKGSVGSRDILKEVIVINFLFIEIVQ